MLYYPDSRIQHAGVILGLGGVRSTPLLASLAGLMEQLNEPVCPNYSAVTGACLVVRREVFEQVCGLMKQISLLPQRHRFLSARPCSRLSQSWTLFAEFYHHESASRGKEDTPERQQRLSPRSRLHASTWGPLLDNDPGYNPNLALSMTALTFLAAAVMAREIHQNGSRPPTSQRLARQLHQGPEGGAPIQAQSLLCSRRLADTQSGLRF